MKLVPGDIIVYRYKNEDEYSLWNGDGTITLLGGKDSPSVKFVITEKSKRILRCVLKKRQWVPRKLEQ